MLAMGGGGGAGGSGGGGAGGGVVHPAILKNANGLSRLIPALGPRLFMEGVSIPLSWSTPDGADARAATYRSRSGAGA